MTDLAAWVFGILSVVFGILNVWQWILSIREKAVRDAHRDHLLAVRQSLQALRASCTEAINLAEVIRTDPARQFIRQFAYHLIGIEGHVSAALGEGSVTPQQISDIAGQPGPSLPEQAHE